MFDENDSKETLSPFVYDLHPNSLIFIDTLEKLAIFRNAVTDCVLSGIDTEKKPDFGRQISPIALVQIATRSSQGHESVFLLDLLTLRQNNAAFLELNEIFKLLFTKESAIKMGQGLIKDFHDLRASYRTLSSCEDIVGVLDTQALYKFLNPSEKNMISLKNLVKVYLKQNLSKTQQLSNWSQRPLTSQQIHYAACDALVLLRLYDAMIPLIQQRCLIRNEIFIITTYFEKFGKNHEIQKQHQEKKKTILLNSQAREQLQQQIYDYLMTFSDSELIASDINKEYFLREKFQCHEYDNIFQDIDDKKDNNNNDEDRIDYYEQLQQSKSFASSLSSTTTQIPPKKIEILRFIKLKRFIYPFRRYSHHAKGFSNENHHHHHQQHHQPHVHREWLKDYYFEFLSYSLKIRQFQRKPKFRIKEIQQLLHEEMKFNFTNKILHLSETKKRFFRDDLIDEILSHSIFHLNENDEFHFHPDAVLITEGSSSLKEGEKEDLVVTSPTTMMNERTTRMQEILRKSLSFLHSFCLSTRFLISWNISNFTKYFLTSSSTNSTASILASSAFSLLQGLFQPKNGNTLLTTPFPFFIQKTSIIAVESQNLIDFLAQKILWTLRINNQSNNDSSQDKRFKGKNTQASSFQFIRLFQEIEKITGSTEGKKLLPRGCVPQILSQSNHQLIFDAENSCFQLNPNNQMNRDGKNWKDQEIINEEEFLEELWDHVQFYYRQQSKQQSMKDRNGNNKINLSLTRILEDIPILENYQDFLHAKIDGKSTESAMKTLSTASASSSTTAAVAAASSTMKEISEENSSSHYLLIRPYSNPEKENLAQEIYQFMLSLPIEELFSGISYVTFFKSFPRKLDFSTVKELQFLLLNDPMKRFYVKHNYFMIFQGIQILSKSSTFMNILSKPLPPPSSSVSSSRDILLQQRNKLSFFFVKNYFLEFVFFRLYKLTEIRNNNNDNEEQPNNNSNSNSNANREKLKIKDIKMELIKQLEKNFSFFNHLPTTKERETFLSNLFYELFENNSIIRSDSKKEFLFITNFTKEQNLSFLYSLLCFFPLYDWNLTIISQLISPPYTKETIKEEDLLNSLFLPFSSDYPFLVGKSRIMAIPKVHRDQLQQQKQQQKQRIINENEEEKENLFRFLIEKIFWSLVYGSEGFYHRFKLSEDISKYVKEFFHSNPSNSSNSSYAAYSTNEFMKTFHAHSFRCQQQQREEQLLLLLLSRKSNEKEETNNLSIDYFISKLQFLSEESYFILNPIYSIDSLRRQEIYPLSSANSFSREHFTMRPQLIMSSKFIKEFLYTKFLLPNYQKTKQPMSAKQLIDQFPSFEHQIHLALGFRDERFNSVFLVEPSLPQERIHEEQQKQQDQYSSLKIDLKSIQQIFLSITFPEEILQAIEFIEKDYAMNSMIETNFQPSRLKATEIPTASVPMPPPPPAPAPVSATGKKNEKEASVNNRLLTEISQFLLSQKHSCASHARLIQRFPSLQSIPTSSLLQQLDEDLEGRFILIDDPSTLLPQDDGFLVFTANQITELSQMEFYIEVIICLLRAKQRFVDNSSSISGPAGQVVEMNGKECRDYVIHRYEERPGAYPEFHHVLRKREEGKRVYVRVEGKTPNKFFFSVKDRASASLHPPPAPVLSSEKQTPPQAAASGKSKENVKGKEKPTREKEKGRGKKEFIEQDDEEEIVKIRTGSASVEFHRKEPSIGLSGIAITRPNNHPVASEKNRSTHEKEEQRVSDKPVRVIHTGFAMARRAPIEDEKVLEGFSGITIARPDISPPVTSEKNGSSHGKEKQRVSDKPVRVIHTGLAMTQRAPEPMHEDDKEEVLQGFSGLAIATPLSSQPKSNQKNPAESSKKHHQNSKYTSPSQFF